MSDHNVENPFGELDDCSKTEKAGQGISSGRLPPAVYKAVCTSVDLEGDGKLVDHNYFETEGGTKSVKIFFEILEPEKVGEETTKGRIHEFVFWCTERNKPYVMRDAETILGKPLLKFSDLLRASWAGKTLEFGVKDEPYNGFIQSKVTFINKWSPEKEGDEKKGSATSKAETKKTEPPKKTETAGAGKKARTDF